MLGDLINKIRAFWFQNVKCSHRYSIKVRNTIKQTFEIKECELCGRRKVKEI